jgi:Ca-activated chloride channel family protein
MDLSAFAAFHFIYPAWAWAMPVLWGAIAWLAWRERRKGAWGGVVEPELLAALRLSTADATSSPWPLLGVLWTGAALALAGPTWQQLPSQAFRAPDDWVVVLDLSPSMAVADVTPDRATRARYAIDDILSAAHDARVALVVFAGEAHTVVPLTTDVATIRALSQSLAPNIMPEAGDDLTPALAAAQNLLAQAASRHGKVVVLSDGFSDPAEALGAAGKLHNAGAEVEVVGIGTRAGAPAVDEKGGFVHDAAGASVLAKLPIDELERLASAGGGRYWPLGDLGGMLKALRGETGNPLDARAEATQLQVGAWRNEGIWLLPPLLLVACLFARRGWL